LSPDRRSRPERTQLAPGLEIPRVVTGLWQVADMERGGTLLDARADARRDRGRAARARLAVSARLLR
jgi:hypothetical protein